ncbi:helix-turn-helix domain-containing protein [Kitasatospora sp. NPDC096147]|uniref:helix-turn-helix domain-containing protein n=1 Tax=Kitasatospora sp. NPDC096147 TaxID=3364093 RepID=UPI003821C21F
MTQEPTPRQIDPRSLRALAHPLRMRILDHLRTHGPATSARLSEPLGESTGTISWHLRHLAEHGFIEEEAGRGTKRERWWRARAEGNVLHTTELRADPQTSTALDVYLAELLRTQYQRVADSLAAEWPEEWRGAGRISDWTKLRLTPGQLHALLEDLAAVVERHTPPADAVPDPAARPVLLQLQALPRTETP